MGRRDVHTSLVTLLHDYIARGPHEKLSVLWTLGHFLVAV
jgi:hypothetical protein